MKLLGRAVTMAGLLAALWVAWHDHPARAFALFRAVGFGLVPVCLAHVLAMLANARDWQTLIRDPRRPGWADMLGLVWIRESVNGLLPVARIGGEVASFRLMRGHGMRPSTAVASLIVDTQLTLISQLMFAAMGIGYLLIRADSYGLHLAGNLTWGVAVLSPVLLLFVLVQRIGPFARFTRLLNRATGGKLASLVGPSGKFDQQVSLIWRRRAVLIRYVFFWQPLQCFGVALEIWLALYFMGAPISFLQAVVYESLLQAISSAAFFVPGGLGVQEGGFILIGRALGVDPVTGLALAGTRRARELLIYLPGLLAWQMAEYSIGKSAAAVSGGDRGLAA